MTGTRMVESIFQIDHSSTVPVIQRGYYKHVPPLVRMSEIIELS